MVHVWEAVSAVVISVRRMPMPLRANMRNLAYRRTVVQAYVQESVPSRSLLTASRYRRIATDLPGQSVLAFQAVRLRFLSGYIGVDLVAIGMIVGQGGIDLGHGRSRWTQPYDIGYTIGFAFRSEGEYFLAAIILD